ncbi:MAG TPA: hypothetical protein VLX61_08495 [Anaerolineales bacterium]|nr:hypothetical protein [Anaerolineales bacterium]
MNRKRLLFLIVGIILLVALVPVAGKRIGASIRSGGNVAAAAGTPVSTPVDFFSQEFSSSTDIVPVGGLAAGGLGDALLKSSVWNTLLDYERKQNCVDVTSKAIRVEQINEADSFWVEDWMVVACSKTEIFKVKFTPDQVGGTIYTIAH